MLAIILISFPAPFGIGFIANLGNVIAENGIRSGVAMVFDRFVQQSVVFIIPNSNLFITYVRYFVIIMIVFLAVFFFLIRKRQRMWDEETLSLALILVSITALILPFMI